jgi:hypothetical protein
LYSFRRYHAYPHNRTATDDIWVSQALFFVKKLFDKSIEWCKYKIK